MFFPDFMIREMNKIPKSQQNTSDIEGYYYTANDGSQMAFWTYKADRESKEHTHEYDEYMICVEGEYIVTINGVAHILHAGDELFIPKGSLQGGKVKAGTRSIHAFGGQRVSQYEICGYNDDLKDEVLSFLSDEFLAAGKTFELDGRHSAYKDISGNFILFACMMYQNRVIGTVAIKRINESDCEMKALYLKKEFQGKKLGYKLASHAMEYARNSGLKKMYLDTMSYYDRAKRLYHSLGFKETDKYNENDKADMFMVIEL